MAGKRIPPVTKENYCRDTRVEIGCKRCDKRFISLRSGHLFCSVDCGDAYRREVRIPSDIPCIQCKRLFKQKTKWQQYCSPECRRVFKLKPKIHKERPCVICGKVFTQRTYRHAYCSKGCNVHSSLAASRRFREKNRNSGACLNCGKPKMKFSSRLCFDCWIKKAVKCAGAHDREAWTKAKHLLVGIQKFTCPYTGRKLIPGVNTSLDHKNPKSRFKKQAGDVDNFEWVDTDVNTAKLAMMKDEFIALCKLVASRFPDKK